MDSNPNGITKGFTNWSLANPFAFSAPSHSLMSAKLG